MSAPRPRRSAPSRAGELRALTGMALAGLLLGGVATLVLSAAGQWMGPATALAAGDPAAASGAQTVYRRAVDRAAGVQATSQKLADEKNAAAGVGPAPPAAAAKTATPPAKIAATAVKAAAAPPAVAATAPKASRPAGTSMPTAPTLRSAPGPTAVRTMARVDEQVTFQYNALGRRDPFQPLVGGEFVGMDIGGDAPPDIGGIKVVGIVWGAEDRFAMVEDARGNSMVLRRGDKVMNGVVRELKRDAVVVQLTADGQSESVSIPLTRKGDQSNANR
ncbi:MAG: hypothetical protein A2W00_14860 [Candidatus Eisenbacteria bacterium RBG_16_71_46]|nr:MAG: hypothetical protein A2W00_14860 [Candidatus Eisenbacteria bacterium RBG_16_71_46]OGF24456.1 MAG: hypothetical protein A2V63_03760 [Candidatus Eisenbacteria bacterium RBG_19FT_COMBO_70_11]